MRYPRHEVRTAIQNLLDTSSYMTARDIYAALVTQGYDEITYTQINRALNSPRNEALGETPFAITDNPDYGVVEGEPKWAWFAVTPDHPLTQREFTVKTATALTQLTKTRDNLLLPAVNIGAIANGDGDDLVTSLRHLDASIVSLESARIAGEVKAQQVANESERAALEAERQDIERRRRELEAREAALSVKS
jgi:hypothetical protein